MLIKLVTFLLFLIIPQQIAICFNLIPWIPVILLLPERVSYLSSTYNLLAKGFNGMTNFSTQNSGIMLASLTQLSVLKQWTQPLASFQLNSISRFGWKKALTQDTALNGQRYTAVLWRFFQSSKSKSSLSEKKLKIRSFTKHTPLLYPFGTSTTPTLFLLKTSPFYLFHCLSLPLIHPHSFNSHVI